MTDDQKLQYESKLRQIINEQVELSVNAVVNSKIDALTKTLNDYIKVDTAWKQTAQPYVNIAQDGKGFITIFKYLVVGLTAIGILITTLFKILTYIK